MQLSVNSLSQIPQAAEAILANSAGNKIFLFYGEMGAGKTTLIKTLCEQLGVTEQATSPTFSIVNEYIGRDSRIFHFDFYRLKNQTEALDMGYEEYFYSGAYCFIEWPEKIPDLLPEHYANIRIQVLDSNSRGISIENI
ncbi:tRNA (adenosine(37)-N6)-threonylcarbamoyltransferase complex ATPase subunit type 1 TsaE [Mucilaginibacter sp. SMC90]|uniref:tRNA (adenosine(37)-N6)-threonylcarbamoyltransferase complex ATPase subunit type 1 TsaE n=1 Tax=Mucilaginibacter sp. SMC90 TaxID=2929803 RepID=UPI001FB4AF69|nr:tRNA (adenosine(37)-N6)-threonylcarbamoyltransferase complex ATPase subunit type 1 TsaE [Mucilaginibacter sp. SMC90]UOE49501.1 tRNA (adenosine(37)-N6)-threonylcarbamoyltransferase complex ATPase subunit type 1 TsaE [Mucilaginibacter sp. SMC90]